MIKRIAMVASLLLVTATARADLILTLDDGMGASVTVSDGGAGDMSAEAGAVTFIGALGSFMVNVSTGISAPVMGSLIEPILHLNSVDVSGANGGTLSINLTATGFLSPFDATHFGLMFGGVTDGSVTATGYLDTTNAAFGTNTPLGSISAAGGAFGDLITGPVDIDATPYSLTLMTTIVHGGSGVSSFDADLRIPEPTTLAIFGLGLLMLGLGRKRIPVKL